MQCNVQALKRPRTGLELPRVLLGDVLKPRRRQPPRGLLDRVERRPRRVYEVQHVQRARPRGRGVGLAGRHRGGGRGAAGVAGGGGGAALRAAGGGDEAGRRARSQGWRWLYALDLRAPLEEAPSVLRVPQISSSPLPRLLLASAPGRAPGWLLQGLARRGGCSGPGRPGCGVRSAWNAARGRARLGWKRFNRAQFYDPITRGPGGLRRAVRQGTPGLPACRRPTPSTLLQLRPLGTGALALGVTLRMCRAI